MLTQYICAVLDRAVYEVLPDGTVYGEIPGFQSMYANADTHEACRNELREVLEGWIVLNLHLVFSQRGVTND